MSGYLMHSDPDVYPSPFTFDPDRWLGDIDPHMLRNFVPFTRGRLLPPHRSERMLTPRKLQGPGTA